MHIFKFIFILATFKNVISIFNEQDIIEVQDNNTFILTFGFEQYRSRISEQNILKFNATQDSDSLILNAYNITDYTQNPRVLITNQLQMLLDILNLDNSQTTPSNTKFINCVLTYSKQCIINELSTQVKNGDTFYLTFLGVGMNQFSFGKINPHNINTTQNESKQNLHANSDNQLILLNTTDEKKLVLKLQQQHIKQSNNSLIGEVEVLFLHPSGELLGDKGCEFNQDCKNEWNHETNLVQLKQKNELISKNLLLFSSNMQKNRQFVQQFDLKQIMENQNEEDRDIELHIQQDYKQKSIIGIAVKYKVISEESRSILLTQSVFTVFQKNSDQQKKNEVVLHYFHPLFEYLSSKDQKNYSYFHLQHLKNKKLVIEFETEQIDSNTQRQLQSKIYYSQQSLNSEKIDQIFSGVSKFKIDVSKMQQVEEDKNFLGFYLQLYLIDDATKEDDTKYAFHIKSNLLLQDEELIENKGDNTNSNDNIVKTDTTEQKDDTMLILIIALISFIVFSILIYVKCIRNRSQNIGSPQQLEELGEDGEKNNENYDIENVHAKNDGSNGITKKPQSTKSIKTNGNHIQLAQEDEKSSIDYQDNHSSTFRKTKNHTQNDLSATNLQQDRSKLIEKKPILRQKNKKNHLRIEVEDAQYDKEREQAQIKLQQLKLMQQQALKQKQRQQNK